MVISSPGLILRTAVRVSENEVGSHSHFALGPQLLKKRRESIQQVQIRNESGYKLTYDYTSPSLEIFLYACSALPSLHQEPKAR